MSNQRKLLILGAIAGVVFGLFASFAYGLWGFIGGMAWGMLFVRGFYWFWVFTGHNPDDI